MIAEFRMPSLGADMEAGTLVEWLKKPGERIRRGEPIAVVETEKGAIDVECYEEGTLLRYLVEIGARVPVGMALAELETAAGALPPKAEDAAAPAAAPAGSPPPGAPLEAQPAPQESGLRASPAARRLASRKGIDLAQLTGSGPDGAISYADVEAAAAAEPAERKAFDVAAMRKAVGAAMARSKREIPHYYLAHDVDLSNARRWLVEVNADRDPDRRVLIAALFLKSTALALAKNPNLNGFWAEGGFRPSDAVHVGMAVAIRGGGLVAPAIHDTDKLALDDLMQRLKDNVTRARAGRLRSSELADATATVSSLGERGVDTLYGVITPPQVAIVGFGRPRPRPWVVDDGVEPRETVTVTLAADHRASDGQRGALFLAGIDRLLQRPEAL